MLIPSLKHFLLTVLREGKACNTLKRGQGLDPMVIALILIFGPPCQMSLFLTNAPFSHRQRPELFGYHSHTLKAFLAPPMVLHGHASTSAPANADSFHISLMYLLTIPKLPFGSAVWPSGK